VSLLKQSLALQLTLSHYTHFRSEVLIIFKNFTSYTIILRSSYIFLIYVYIFLYLQTDVNTRSRFHNAIIFLFFSSSYIHADGGCMLAETCSYFCRCVNWDQISFLYIRVFEHNVMSCINIILYYNINTLNILPNIWNLWPLWSNYYLSVYCDFIFVSNLETWKCT